MGDIRITRNIANCSHTFLSNYQHHQKKNNVEGRKLDHNVREIAHSRL